MNQEKQNSGTLKKDNVFWVVEDQDKRYVLFNSQPRKEKWHSYYTDKDSYIWVANHSHHYLSEKTSEKFKDIKGDDMVKVKLTITDGDNPDLYMQRYKDCLFVNYYLERYWHEVKQEKKFIRLFSKYKWVENERVSHDSAMISNKLFPEVTEETGVVKLNIERI